jgi:hypothetical protein
MRRLLVLLAALGVVAGCSTSIGGTPSPVAGPTASNPAANGLTLPPRPRELKLDGIDPCSSLTPPQLAKLGLNRTVPSISADSPSLDGKICTAGGSDPKQIDVSIAFVTRPGIDYITTGPTASFGSFMQVRIAGFSGIVEPQQEQDICAVDLDVAAGQFVQVLYHDAKRPPTLSRSELCEGAVSAGEVVMQSLLDSR